jgi:hypothetical protein
MPSSGYKGQNLKMPVSNGTIPIQPQGEKIPVAARVIKITPAMMRIALSIVPTFAFMIFLVKWFNGMAMIMKFFVYVDYSKYLMICLYTRYDDIHNS